LVAQDAEAKTIIENEVRASTEITISGENNIQLSIVSSSQSSTEKIFQLTVENISQMDSFLGEKNLSQARCKNINLVVYHIPYDILNNRRIMSFLDWSAWNNLNVTGIYVFDSVRSPTGTGTIYISNDLRGEILNKTIKHELIHFWQDLTCNTAGNMELLSVEFEKTVYD